MTRIESEKVSVNKSSADVFTYLQKMENIGNLLPEQVENFTFEERTTSAFQSYKFGILLWDY
jgi:hypothetical protein